MESARVEAAHAETVRAEAQHVETAYEVVAEPEPVDSEHLGEPEAAPEPVVAPAQPESTQPSLAQPEPVVEDELTTAYQEWQNAKSQGDRKTARALNERVVELLRPRAEQDLAEYGPRLLYALEELSSARLRAGELFASRGPAREAKALAKSLGRR